MGRQLFNNGEEIVQQDFNDMHKLIEKEYNDDFLYRLFQNTSGFIADSFKVLFVNATTVDIQDGRGFQYDSTITDPKEPKYRGVDLDSVFTQTLNAAHASLPRIDIIAVKHSRTVTDTATRKFKDALLLTISNVLFNKADKCTADIVYLAGTPSGSPVAPTTPTGYIKLCNISVPASTGPVSQSDITDVRPLLAIATNIGVTVNTSGKLSLTTLGPSTPIQTVINEWDTAVNALNQIFDDTNVAKGAALVGFEPAVPSDWTVPPDDAGKGLNELADRVTTLEAGAGSIYDVVLGDASDVTAGIATHSTWASAFAALPSGGSMKILANRSFTETVSINKACMIEGSGASSVLDGTVTFTNAADLTLMRNVKITGALTLNSGADKIRVVDVFKNPASTWTDNGLDNYIQTTEY